MSKQITMVQVDLVSLDGKREMTTWVDKKPNLKAGAAVRLEGSSEWYKVGKVYELEMERSQIEANRNWDNNDYGKHDGTSMKDRVKSND